VISSPTSPSSPSGEPQGFTELDDRLVEGRPGLLVVIAPPELHPAVLAHAARRVRAASGVALLGEARRGAPMFHEIAAQLAVRSTTTNVARFGAALADEARRRRAAILGALPAEGTWDHEVLLEMASAGLLMVLVSAGPRSPREATRFEIDRNLDRDQRIRWISAAAYDANLKLESATLDVLEARLSVRPESGGDAMSEPGPARDLLTVLTLVARSLPEAALTRGDASLDGALADLAGRGLVTRAGDRVALASAAQSLEVELEASASPALRVRAAELLLEGPADPCPWAHARAAELLAASGDAEAADTAMAKACELAEDIHVAGEISARWHAAVARAPREASAWLRVRAAERALGTGDVHDTQRWCEELLAIAPGDPQASLLMGLALLQVGDLVAARVSLERAAGAVAARAVAGRAATKKPGGLPPGPGQSGADPLASRISAALAEVSYVAGELDRAEVHATRSIDLASTPAATLPGRNVLGKIHLAAGRWAAADKHFVEDALTAAEAGDPDGELRARLNRAIAAVSMGRLDDARTLLERILDDATTRPNPRARSYALRNLAVIAYRRHDYGRALALWEEEVRVSSALCGRVTMAVTLANFAELRLRLGLTDHAAHTVAFGRRLVAGYVAPQSLAALGIVAARVALARSDIEVARREIEAARLNAEAAGDRGDRLPDAYLCAARVALAEGDVERAEAFIAKADGLANTDTLRAEVCILRAHTQRAAGRDALEAARTALAAARAADEEDILVEVHALLAQVAREAGDDEESEAHARWAVRARDRVAESLPPEIRAAFLAKAENVALSRLFTALEGEVEPESSMPAGPVSRASSSPPRALVGDDPTMRRLMVAVRRVARSTSTILVQGESGTGKELVAEAIHRHSARAGGPFVSVNCSALVETLLLSELFGHEKGSFTGASTRKQGRFELATGGTLFLDEIGDISPRTQVALLRVLQERTFERVGGTTPVRVDVRVVCATHRDLRAMVQRGEFREDLYYRIQGVTLEVPPLRARIRDLPSISAHLLEAAATERAEAPRSFTSEALALLMRYRWPGNVRELENVIRASSLFAEGAAITVSELVDYFPQLRALAQTGDGSIPPPSVPPPPLEEAPVADDDDLTASPDASAVESVYSHIRSGAVSLSTLKREIERECIVRALDETHGNITRAAVLLGMKRPRLSQLAKQYGLKAAAESMEESE